MRTLVNYIRQMFCKHDWQIEESFCKSGYHSDYRVYMRCKKCSYHKKHWKFL